MYKGLSGAFLTTSLFYETWKDRVSSQRAKDSNPVFSLYDDVHGLINCRKTFVDMADPTGYSWAMKYLDSWEHWERLVASSWFAEALETWRRELLAKLRAEALVKIKEIADTSVQDGQRLAAAKYLAERGWEKGSKGRPGHKKDEVNKLISQAEQSDAERIGLKLVVDNG